MKKCAVVCISMYGTTKGSNIYKAVTDSFENAVSLYKLSAVCTNSAPAMTESKTGIVGLMNMFSVSKQV